MANLLLLDFDPQVRWIVSQPLRLHFMTQAKKRSHVPDILVRADDGLRIIDVSLPHRRADPDVRLRHEVLAEAATISGVAYEIRGVPEPIRLRNIRLLSAHRVVPWGFEEYASRVRARLDRPRALGEIETAVGPATMVRPVILHLIWKHALECDLDCSLTEETVLRPACPVVCR